MGGVGLALNQTPTPRANDGEVRASMQLPTYMFTKGLKGTFSVIMMSQREGLSVRAYGLSCIILKSSYLSSSCRAVKLYGYLSYVLCRLNFGFQALGNQR